MVKNGRKVGAKVSDESLNNKVKCLVCGQMQKNYIALSKHLKHQHNNLGSRDYYDRFIREFKEGRCKVCGKETFWMNVKEGYKKFCSRKCSSKYFSGENGSFYGRTHSEESLRKIGKASSERRHTEEGKKNISEGLKRSYKENGDFHKTEGYQDKMSTSLMGHESSEERNQKIKEGRSLYYKKWKKKDSQSYKKWTSKRIKSSLAKICERPNVFERTCFENILEKEFPGKFKYVGDGSVLINFKSPDYINEEDKIIVLCHGIYWHLLKDGFENCVENKKLIERRDAKSFEKAGYNVVIIWEDEV